MRSLKNPASSPPSNSREISGLRLEKPNPPTLKPPSLTLSRDCAIGLKKGCACRNAGRWPDSPYAPRSRSELTPGSFGNHGSSPMTHEALKSGYQMRSFGLPNALDSSARTAAVTKTLSRHANSWEPSPPNVTMSVSCWVAVNSEVAPARFPVPGTMPAPVARMPRRDSSMYCVPNVVVERIDGVRSNLKMALRFAVYVQSW